jgi:hypothetical protein
VADGAVAIVPVSADYSLLTGKFAGHFIVSRSYLRFWHLNQRVNSPACSRIAYTTKQGIIFRQTGKHFFEQGIISAEPLTGPSRSCISAEPVLKVRLAPKADFGRGRRADEKKQDDALRKDAPGHGREVLSTAIKHDIP